MEGAPDGHAHVAETRDGYYWHVHLASLLNEGAMVLRHKPAGFHGPMVAGFATHVAGCASGYCFFAEAKLLSVDGAKVHVSARRILTLLKARVFVIAELFKLSHRKQALATYWAVSSPPCAERCTCALTPA